LAIIQSIIALPLVVLAIIGNLLPTDEVSIDSSTADAPEHVLEILLLIAAIAVIGALLSLTVQLAMLHALVQRATGQPVSVGAALVGGLRRFPPLLGWGFLQGLMIVVGLLFCLLPGIYVILALYVLPAVVLLERGNGIGRTFELFHANFGAAIARVATIVGVTLAFALVEGAFSTVISGGSLFSDGNVGTVAAVADGVVSVTLSIISSIVVTPLLLTAYADMRARREPFSTAYLVPQPYTPDPPQW
jgi:hypothetical protein